MRHDMTVERSDYVQREKQIKVLQETIRNMQTQLLQTKLREQKDSKTIEHLERNLKDAGVKQLLLKTKIKETADKLKDKGANSAGTSNASNTSNHYYTSEDSSGSEPTEISRAQSEPEIIDIDKDDDVRIIEHQSGVVEIHEIEDDDKIEPSQATEVDNSKESIKDSSKPTSMEAGRKTIAEEALSSSSQEVSFPIF